MSMKMRKNEKRIKLKEFVIEKWSGLKKKLSKESLKIYAAKAKKIIANPRFLTCLAIGWIITNGWAYLMLAAGTLFNVVWMKAVSGTYLGLLWMPGTPEKLITFAITLWLLKLWHPEEVEALKAILKAKEVQAETEIAELPQSSKDAKAA